MRHENQGEEEGFKKCISFMALPELMGRNSVGIIQGHLFAGQNESKMELKPSLHIKRGFNPTGTILVFLSSP